MASCHICSTAEAVTVCHQCRRMICATHALESGGQHYCTLCRTASADPPQPPAVDLMPRKRRSVWHTRYPAVEITIRLLALLSYAALAAGVVLCLTFIILAAGSEPVPRRLLLLQSVLSLLAAPVGLLLLQFLSQCLRLLVDIEQNTRG